MSEKATISTEMLDAATIQYMKVLGYSEKAIKSKRQDDAASWQDAERRSRLILEAAGVPALLKQIADAEQEMAKVREVLHDHSVYFEAELEKREARIAELEAALSLAIPRMEHLQSLLSCGESVQFCNEFDEQKSKEVAEEIERLKRVMQK